MSACLRLFSMLLICAAAVPVAAGDRDDTKAGEEGPDRAALEKEFSEKLSGSALVGSFTVDGAAGDKPPATERYEIESAQKLKGREDYWTFTARIKYGETDLKVPITLKVLWAGDTPVISLTNLSIPGLGTFTSRVMFYGDRYVGTWQHGKVGGHMWGRVEKPGETEEPSEEEE